MTDPVLVTPPAALLSLGEVKLHLRITDDFEDSLVETFMAAAEAHLDGWNGILHRCILTQTWAVKVEALESTKLPFPDVQSAVVTYLDAGGATQTVAPENYRVRTISGQGWLTFADTYAAPAVLAGRDDAVTISAVFGKAEAPAPLRTAAMMIAAAHYDAARKGEPVSVPDLVNTLVAPYRVGLVG